MKKNLIWVYPRNNWVSNFNKTFVYGWCNPKARLFISVVGVDQRVYPDVKQAKHIGLPIQIFPNGNFAKTIKLPHKKNVVRLIQILNGKKKIVARNVIVGVDQRVYPNVKQGKHIGLPVQPVHKKNIVIVIDPGHGGKEHGTHSPKGVPEKHFNLQIAKLLFKKLNGIARSRGMPRHASTRHIYLTRSKDKYVSLKDRVLFAKKKKCNIFISIHHNALPDNEDPLKHRGVGIYYTHDFVKPFAKSLLQSIAKESGLKKYGIFKRDFALTRPDFYTGLLIECGFLIHPVESEIITQRKIQKKIVRGIMSIFYNVLRNSSNSGGNSVSGLGLCSSRKFS